MYVHQTFWVPFPNSDPLRVPKGTQKEPLRVHLQEITALMCAACPGGVLAVCSRDQRRPNIIKINANQLA